MIHELKIPQKDIDLIQSELEFNKPFEPCGDLIGTIDGSTALVENAVPITNAKRTRTSFELDPKEHYKAWNEAEKNAGDCGKCIIPILSHRRYPRCGIGRRCKT